MIHQRGGLLAGAGGLQGLGSVAAGSAGRAGLAGKFSGLGEVSPPFFLMDERENRGRSFKRLFEDMKPLKISGLEITKNEVQNGFGFFVDFGMYIRNGGDSGDKSPEAAPRLALSVPTRPKMVGTGWVWWGHFSGVPTKWGHVPTIFRQVGTPKPAPDKAFRALSPLSPPLPIYQPFSQKTPKRI